jgi:alpha-1,2-mannosyltransferase
MAAVRGWSRAGLALAVIFAALNTANAINKGGDATVFFEGGRRFLHGLPLYEGSSAAAGFIGPPFQAMFFAPFAAIAARSEVAARLVWYALNLMCLIAGIALTLRAWTAVRARAGLPVAPWQPALFASLAAVLFPLQTNFEHQNMNTLLLALVAGAMLTLTTGSAAIAGALVGFAAALKAFPALCIAYFAAARNWTACLVSLFTAAVLSLLPALAYGPEGFGELVATWLRLGRSGWPTRGNNQSLVAAIDRWTGGAGVEGVRTAADAPVTITLFAAVAVLLVLILGFAIVRATRSAACVPAEIAAVATLAILLSPIAWDHYWTLLFPAFLILYDSRDPTLLGSRARPLFWIAAVLTTGVSPLTVGRSGLAVARELSAGTVAAAIVYASLVVICLRWARKPIRERTRVNDG